MSTSLSFVWLTQFLTGVFLKLPSAHTPPNLELKPLEVPTHLPFDLKGLSWQASTITKLTAGLTTQASNPATSRDKVLLLDLRQAPYFAPNNIKLCGHLCLHSPLIRVKLLFATQSDSDF
jgi:hypothetical protein